MTSRAGHEKPRARPLGRRNEEETGRYDPDRNAADPLRRDRLSPLELDARHENDDREHTRDKCDRGAAKKRSRPREELEREARGRGDEGHPERLVRGLAPLRQPEACRVTREPRACDQDDNGRSSPWARLDGCRGASVAALCESGVRGAAPSRPREENGCTERCRPPSDMESDLSARHGAITLSSFP